MKIAFLSLDDLSGYVADDDLVFAPLRALGHVAEFVPWQQTAARWRAYDAVVIRATWDYQHKLAAFLSVLQQIEAQTRLANPFEIVRWNADKVYLRDLAEKGASVVPTLWHKGKIERRQLEQWFEQLQTAEIVIKPTVSASAQDTLRLQRGAVDVALLSQLFDQRSCMVQPFLRSITEEGEFSLFYFNGAYSHAVLKTPKAADFRVQEEHGATIRAIEPPANLRTAGKHLLQSVSAPLLYARVDFVRTEGAEFALMELELIEPSMYLRTAAHSPRLFAAAINQWLLQGQL